MIAVNYIIVLLFVTGGYLDRKTEIERFNYCGAPLGMQELFK